MSEVLPDTIPAALDRAVEELGDREALVDEDVRWTWSELAAHVDVAARALLATGIERGDRVAIWSPNVGEWVVAALAVQRVGGAVATMNTRFKGHEGAYNIRTSGARLLFSVTDFLDTDYVALLEADGGVPDCLDEIIVFRGPTPGETTSWTDFLARSEQSSSDAVQERFAEVSGEDMCDIIFTSGTTGAPKGAMMGHAASIRAFWAWTDVIGLRSDDRHLIVYPFFHAFGLYIGDPDATAEAIDADGWLHTGDVGVLDAAGNIKITDRLKDMFITGGFNVYPAEVEAILWRHPEVAQASVVGVPDERMGEVCAAFVIPRSDSSLDPESMISWSRDNMANYKVPRLVEVVDSLPMNASNKVLKFELRDRAATRRG
ncbi:MAG: AMP-binding protein [Acidimicrobiales bacterium]|nr:AMP-binding protein [Acidimicrobiales bacterium]